MPATIRLRQHEAARPAPADALSCARRARWTTHFLLLPLVLLLGACELGGSAGGAASEVAGASSIDLPPGQTEATLAWTPSSGDVDNYIVYESRNGGDYEYLISVVSPSVSISGSEGDAVRIFVLAINLSGQSSTPSPPSSELVFHAAEPTAAATSFASSAPPAAQLAPEAEATPDDLSLDPTPPASEDDARSGSVELAEVSDSDDS
ncbi:MAG: hypothetical protein V3T64_03560, partial [Myxococcota bacterium]